MAESGGQERRPDEGFDAIAEREAVDDRERRDSKLLYDALAARRDELGGQGRIPRDDQRLSATILNEARQRSAEISGAAHRAGAPTDPRPRGVPGWLILAWIVAIVAIAAAYRWL